MNHQQFAKLYPWGSHLCREPMPAMAELKADMENLKRHGFNLIKLQEHWGIDEPREGHYDFSKYEELIEHAAKLNLGVYLGLTCEQAPHWLWRKHPECRMVGRNGLPVAYEAAGTLPADGKPGPCFDHEGAAADMCRFITRLVTTLGHYENLVIWNTWQEVSYWGEADFILGQGVCFCENTLRRFRNWLRETWHGDLDALNRAWNTRYGDFDYITPNRNLRAKEGTFVDAAWNYFIPNVKIADVLRLRAKTIRAADPLRRPVFAHVGSPTIGAGFDWTLARCQDFLGTSSYPAWFPFQGWDDRPNAKGRVERHASLLAETHNSTAMLMDYVRGLNEPGKPVWGAEFQGGPINTWLHKGRVPSPQDIRRWTLMSVASGVTGISFWVTRAEIAMGEANGFSLLDSAGDTTPRLEEAGRIGAALNRHASLFAPGTAAPSQVAILINEWNYQVLSTIGPGISHLAMAVRGWHRLLWDAGISVDFLNADDLETRGGQYRAIILPLPLSLADGLAAKLRAYVEGGGQLISDAAPGRYSEYAYCNRGELAAGARDLFGVDQESFTMVREPEDGVRWSERERTWGEYLDAAMLGGAGTLAGQELRANVYIETYRPRPGTTAILTQEGRTAGTTRAVGKGRAWLLGTFAGHCGLAYRDEASHNCIRRLLAECGVKPEHAGKLLLRKRIGSDAQAWLFFNPLPEAVSEPINTAGWKSVEDLLDEPVARKGSVVELRVEPLDMRVLILR